MKRALHASAGEDDMSATPTAKGGPARAEWAGGWPLILACAVGVSTPSAQIFALGQFMAPLEQEFGWTRAEVSLGMTLSLIVGFVMSPIVGRISDLTNSRNLVLVGLVLSGLSNAAYSLANGNLVFWVALWAIDACVGVLIAPVVWLSVIPAQFTVHRNLANALALAGTSLSAAFAPGLARALLDHYDWRTSMQLFSVIWYGGTLLLAALCFFDRRVGHVRVKGAPKAKAAETPGAPSVWAVFRTTTFLKMALIVCAVKTMLQAYMIHLAPSLVSHGFNVGDAAKIAGVAGLAAICGKLCVGWLFDRTPMSVVSAGVMTALATACVLFALLDTQPIMAIAASISLGLANGSMLTVVACFAAALFKPQSFGVVFGAMCSMMAVGTAVGPMLASLTYDRFGVYTPIYWVGIGVAAAALLLMRTLKPAVERQPAPAAAAAAE
jgi:predicted MFS family arabinose efflux permease